MEPLRGYKGTYFEGGIRVPMFVVWPGQIAPGGVSDTPVHQIDWYPTVCEISGAKLPDDHPLDGQNLLPLLTGAAALPERPLYWHFPAYLESYPERIDQQRDPLFRSRPCSVIREGRWKLIYYLEDQATRLYDLELDPSETTDGSRNHALVCSQLLGKLQQWQVDVDADLPNHPNPKYSAAADRAAQLERVRSEVNNRSEAGPARWAKTLPEAKRILFLGDSITYSGRYISLLEYTIRRTDPERQVELLNLGLPSETVSGLSEPGHANG